MGWPVFALPPWKKLSAPRSRSSRSAQEDGCSSLPCRGVLSFRGNHGRHRAVRRREFITLLGGAAAAWPLAASAQQQAMPVVGWLSTRAPGEGAYLLAAFRQGLKEAGYVEGQNVTLEFRWGEGHYERMPAYAAELVRRAVT